MNIVYSEFRKCYIFLLINTCKFNFFSGASFIFYNCARIATLLEEFEKRIQKNVYPKLPQLANVDFSLANQPVSILL